jgi:hypothetical protein
MGELSIYRKDNPWSLDLLIPLFLGPLFPWSLGPLVPLTFDPWSLGPAVHGGDSSLWGKYRFMGKVAVCGGSSSLWGR